MNLLFAQNKQTVLSTEIHGTSRAQRSPPVVLRELDVKGSCCTHSHSYSLVTPYHCLCRLLQAITGSGIIAIEFAKIFRNLGTDVTLIIRDQVPRNALQKIGLDKDVAATLVADLVRSGIKIVRGAQATSFEVPSEKQIPVTIQLSAPDGSPLRRGYTTEIKCDAYLAAVGREPNTASLNLDAVGINLDEYGGILVDSRLCTSSPTGNIFSAGDCLGRRTLLASARACISRSLSYCKHCAIVM
jgi:NAD(P)H-nitrite reductase large subunit